MDDDSCGLAQGPAPTIKQGQVYDTPNYLFAGGGGGGGGGFLAFGGLGDTPSRCPHIFTTGLVGFGTCCLVISNLPSLLSSVRPFRYSNFNLN